eukprot:CAMPEP_0206297178 /NCGR_PEP_ID=MMETSP0106_2-20121207/6041_1 /ASSEMBLY_ACC=CAM_ASM_000206 /TAXON_ID=81532 /ORGANISM="Acanthoeca-like sp., Strain 10tr" /LENGTH=100 /DNA_ID=CAMNT_0053727841 /DNA_START=269 /DNA_END=571 /DNA_ORIENTATION=-
MKCAHAPKQGFANLVHLLGRRTTVLPKVGFQGPPAAEIHGKLGPNPCRAAMFRKCKAVVLANGGVHRSRQSARLEADFRLDLLEYFVPLGHAPTKTVLFH